MNMRTMMSCATALLLAIGGALTACDVEDPTDLEDRLLEDEEQAAESLNDEAATVLDDAVLDDLVDPAEQDPLALTCGQQLAQGLAYCDSAFDPTADFACCMSNISCKKNTRWDNCDCLYALGSPAHQACYNSVAGQFLVDKQVCKNLMPF